MSVREAHRQVTRQRILDAVIDLVSEGRADDLRRPGGQPPQRRLAGDDLPVLPDQGRAPRRGGGGTVAPAPRACRSVTRSATRRSSCARCGARSSTTCRWFVARPRRRPGARCATAGTPHRARWLADQLARGGIDPKTAAGSARRPLVVAAHVVARVLGSARSSRSRARRSSRRRRMGCRRAGSRATREESPS